MKFTNKFIDKFKSEFTLGADDDFVMEFGISVIPNGDGTLTAYIGTYPKVNGYDKKRKVTSTEEVAAFFSEYIDDLQKI